MKKICVDFKWFERQYPNGQTYQCKNSVMEIKAYDVYKDTIEELLPEFLDRLEEAINKKREGDAGANSGFITLSISRGD
jgi:hypothetical protein